MNTKTEILVGQSLQPANRAKHGGFGRFSSGSAGGLAAGIPRDCLFEEILCHIEF